MESVCREFVIIGMNVQRHEILFRENRKSFFWTAEVRGTDILIYHCIDCSWLSHVPLYDLTLRVNASDDFWLDAGACNRRWHLGTETLLNDSAVVSPEINGTKLFRRNSDGNIIINESLFESLR